MHQVESISNNDVATSADALVQHHWTTSTTTTPTTNYGSVTTSLTTTTPSKVDQPSSIIRTDRTRGTFQTDLDHDDDNDILDVGHANAKPCGSSSTMLLLVTILTLLVMSSSFLFQTSTFPTTMNEISTTNLHRSDSHLYESDKEGEEEAELDRTDLRRYAFDSIETSYSWLLSSSLSSRSRKNNGGISDAGLLVPKNPKSNTDDGEEDDKAPRPTNDNRTNKDKKIPLSLLLIRHSESSHIIAMDEETKENDFIRPLDEYGIEQSHRIGETLREQRVPFPDLVYVSSSVRTRQTWEIVQSEWIRGISTSSTANETSSSSVASFDAPHFQVIYTDDLFDLAFGDHGGYLQFLQTQLGHDCRAIIAKKNTNDNDSISKEGATTATALCEHRRVLLVGHNPAIQQLRDELVSSPLPTNDVTVVDHHLRRDKKKRYQSDTSSSSSTATDDSRAKKQNPSSSQDKKTKFPTGGFYEIWLDSIQDWNELRQGSGRSVRFLDPADLSSTMHESQQTE